MGLLQLIADRTKLLPPRRGARDRQLDCTWPAHVGWVGGHLADWGGGDEEDGRGSETHFESSKLKTLWLCVPPTPPFFQSTRLKGNRRTKTLGLSV